MLKKIIFALYFVSISTNVFGVKQQSVVASRHQGQTYSNKVLYEKEALELVECTPSDVINTNSASELRMLKKKIDNFIDTFCDANYKQVDHKHEQIVTANKLVGGLLKIFKSVCLKLETDQRLYDSCSEESFEESSYEEERD